VNGNFCSKQSYIIKHRLHLIRKLSIRLSIQKYLPVKVKKLRNSTISAKNNERKFGRVVGKNNSAGPRKTWKCSRTSTGSSPASAIISLHRPKSTEQGFYSKERIEILRINSRLWLRGDRTLVYIEYYQGL